MSGAGKATAAVRLFDAHCHLQDRRISAVAPQLIRTALDSGVLRFAVNGVSEKDWHLVKQLSEQYPCVIPCFGLHPWFITERSPNWLRSMRELFVETPAAAVGEIGLDKGSHGKKIEFSEQSVHYSGTTNLTTAKRMAYFDPQVEVFQQQLELAKELERPASIHCVRAYGDLLEILQSTGPFPAGVILHSYLGSAEMVSELAKIGSYFSFSGFLTSMKPQKAKKMLKSVPIDRILFETDAPDGLPKLDPGSLFLIPADNSIPQEQQSQLRNLALDASTLPKEDLNHPANIHSVLNYVATLLEMPEEELGEASYRNAMRLFSYPGSKICGEG